MENVEKVLDLLVFWVFTGIGYLLRLIHVQPTEENILIALVLVVTPLTIAVLWEWLKVPVRKPVRTEARPVMRENPTNGLVAPQIIYPLVYELKGEDGTQGLYVKTKENGPAWISIGSDDCYKSVLTRQIAPAEVSEADKRLKAEPFGIFRLRDGNWKVERRYSFKPTVKAGTPPNYTEVEYVLASVPEEERDTGPVKMILIEIPTVPNKTKRFQTWTLSDLTPISTEDFDAAVDEVLDQI